MIKIHSKVIEGIIIMENKNVVFSTPWFKIVAKEFTKDTSPYYVIESSDCVSIIALTHDKEILLVKQYRPTLSEETLEVPSGHIENIETPEKAIYRELLEETGYMANDVELLGVLTPDTGRAGHKVWCYFASNVIQVKEHEPAEINELVKCSPSKLLQFIQSGEMKHALDIAAIFLAIQKGKLSLKI